MGISWIQSIRAEHSNMKIFVVLSAVVAATYAEADADAGILGLGLYGYGYGHGLKSAPCVNAANVPVPCAGGYLHYGKREADAEADAAVLYSGFGYPAYGYAGLGYAGLGYAAPAVVAAAPAVVAAAPAAVVQNAVLGTADLPNPVHAVAHTLLGTVHSSHIGVCTNYLGEQVDC